MDNEDIEKQIKHLTELSEVFLKFIQSQNNIQVLSMAKDAVKSKSDLNLSNIIEDHEKRINELSKIIESYGNAFEQFQALLKDNPEAILKIVK